MKCPSRKQTFALDLRRLDDDSLIWLMRACAFRLVVSAVRKQREQGAGDSGDTECPMCGNAVSWAIGDGDVVEWAECEALGCLQWPRDSE